MSGFEGFLFSCVVSHGIGGFEDVCEDSGGESFEEQVGGFGIPLGVSGLSGKLFEIGDILSDVGPPHATLLEGDSSSLLLIGVLELGLKLVEELGPDDGEVVVDSIESVNPDTHVSYPSGNFVSFDKGEGKGDFLDWRIESCNVFIDAEVRFVLRSWPYFSFWTASPLRHPHHLIPSAYYLPLILFLGLFISLGQLYLVWTIYASY